MEIKKLTFKETEKNAIKMAIIKLRYEMREHAKFKTIDYRKELNYVYKQLENILSI